MTSCGWLWLYAGADVKVVARDNLTVRVEPV